MLARPRAHRPLLALGVALLVVAPLLAIVPAGAQTGECKPTIEKPICDRKPAPSPSPSPSPEPPSDPAPSPSPGGEDPGPPGSGGGGSGGGGGGGGGSTGPGGRNGGPGGGRGGTGAILEAVGRALRGIDLPFLFTGPNSTADLLVTLKGLAAYGIPLDESLQKVAGPFPVAGPAWWTNDWHACRDGCARKHKGLDIFAPRNTPLVAAADGVISQKGTGALAGRFVEIEDSGGVQYFYAHLEDWPEGLEAGDRVKTGDVVGYVGNSGNAISTPTHVHFELQPGGTPVPPKPHVDRWLRIAERRAEALVHQSGVVAAAQAPLLADDFRLLRGFDLSGGAGTQAGGAAVIALPPGPSLAPGVGSLSVARKALADMSWELDWEALDVAGVELPAPAGIEGLPIGGPHEEAELHGDDQHPFYTFDPELLPDPPAVSTIRAEALATRAGPR